MKKLFWSKTGKIWAVIALLAVFIPSFALADLSPVLDGAGLYQVGNKSISDDWGTSTTASPGQTVSFLIHIHNNVINTTAHNIHVQATLPAGEVTSYTSRAIVSASNASSVAGEVNVNLTESAKLEYVPGSTVMYDHNDQFESNLPDGITAGGINVLSDLNGCWQYEKWISFKARLVEVPKANVHVRIIKFNDANGNGVQDNGEVTLSGWQFKITGNGIDQTVTTDASGIAYKDGLPLGTYTITEVGQDGWSSTTGTSITREVTADPATQDFYFGNHKNVTPVCTSPNGCTVTPPQTLPSSGPEELAGMFVGSMAAAGGALSWLRSKKNLAKASLKR